MNKAHSPTDTAVLRKRIEQPTIAYLWGSPEEITPRLVDKVFGDGQKLVALTPIMFRPNYFVIRIDSSTNTSHSGEWLDDICAAIEDQYLEWPWAEDYGLDDDSALDLSEGFSWYEIELIEGTNDEGR